MSYPFSEVRVFLNYAIGHTVQWTLDAAFKEDEPYQFTLEASETPNFEELIFSNPVGQAFYAKDNFMRKQSFHQSYIYRVKLETDSGNRYYSANVNHDTSSMDKRKYLLAAEMTRKELVDMSFTGRPGWLLKRKGYGQTASQEKDPISGVVMTDNYIDYGTGLVGGYHEPIKITYAKSAEDTQEGLSQEGYGGKQTKRIGIRMVGFPLVEKHDILVTAEDERFLFMKIVSKHFPGTNVILRQNCDLTRIASTDSVYKIQVQ